MTRMPALSAGWLKRTRRAHMRLHAHLLAFLFARSASRAAERVHAPRRAQESSQLVCTCAWAQADARRHLRLPQKMHQSVRVQRARARVCARARARVCASARLQRARGAHRAE
eukprot:5895170-Pleurochrysis_carterae.AAC.1